jgi:3-deoxy-7-phosphoheptulonate synthase
VVFFLQLSELILEFRDSTLWQPHSWRSFSASQQPEWGESDALASVTDQLKRMPGLVGPREIESLKHMVTEAGQGRRFLLQGGDCAERFQDCREDVIRSKMRIILQMSLVMGYAGRKPVVPIGRMAGQYAKPRSEALELDAEGRQIPIFRGESVNSFDPKIGARWPDPLRLLQAYHSSSATLNFIRMLMTSGFGELRNIDDWDIGRLRGGAYWKKFELMAAGLRDAMAFMTTVSGEEHGPAVLRGGFREFFVSHEALLLPYEEALTRFVSEMGRYYNLSTHMLWIGDRTRDLDGAHVEYCRGVGNPVGIKVGPAFNGDALVDVIRRVNPHNEPGKVIVITRLGAEVVTSQLPLLIRTLQRAGLNVTWSVDPMHGNTRRVLGGRKTRRFEDVVSEMRQSFDIHAREGSVLGGLHLELTADDVTECTGGTSGVKDEMLGHRYETWCDPRLNGTQSLEISFLAAACLRQSILL